MANHNQNDNEDENNVQSRSTSSISLPAWVFYALLLPGTAGIGASGWSLLQPKIEGTQQYSISQCISDARETAKDARLSASESGKSAQTAVQIAQNLQEEHRDLRRQLLELKENTRNAEEWTRLLSVLEKEVTVNTRRLDELEKHDARRQ